jgi:putative Mn2+ efflux pump MntP
MDTFTSGFGLSLDSLVAGFAIGHLSLSWRERLNLAIAFGAWDAAASFAGLGFPHRSLEPPSLMIYILCALLLGRAAQSSRNLLYALPAVFSIDNFFSGCPANAALALGLSSTILSLFGLSVAVACRELFRSQPTAV